MENEKKNFDNLEIDELKKNFKEKNQELKKIYQEIHNRGESSFYQRSQYLFSTIGYYLPLFFVVTNFFTYVDEEDLRKWTSKLLLFLSLAYISLIILIIYNNKNGK